MSEIPCTPVKCTSSPSSKPETLKRSNSQIDSSTHPRSIKKKRDVKLPLRQNSTFTNIFNEEPTIWTPKHWKRLEDWYIRKNRDYIEAGKSFYHFESLIREGGEIVQELWPIEKILWRSKCLDTSTKRHGGLVPSQRMIVPSTPELSRTPTRTPDRTPISTPTGTPMRTPMRTPVRLTSRTPVSNSNNHSRPTML